MFYTTEKNDHGLPHDPFKAIIAPRPIGWITSMSASGAINLAPYSYFNGVHSKPPMVMFASEGRKDSLAFVEETKEFVCNLAIWDLRDQMNQTSAPYPRGTNELAQAGLTLDDMDVIELNEAFAAQSLACLRELGIADDDARVNPNGGAIAIGHPLGMSGARLLLTATRQLQLTGKRYALATMCIGVGQGMAVILEKA